MIGPLEIIRPEAWDREAVLPPLGLIPAGSLSLDEVRALKKGEGVPVHLVFPVGAAREAHNLRQLLAGLRPLQGWLIDQTWIAFGGRRLGNLTRLVKEFPEVKIFPARRGLPPDQKEAPAGKGATMRAFLHHLVMGEKVTQPRTVIEFLDADIRPAYFNPRWVLDPVGAILRFGRVEAAKIVYQRPRGGRLNAMLRSLIALCPHPGVQALQKLAYLLSGEMAGTLKFWTSLPFKSGYGVETLTLLSFALDRLRLVPGTADLEHLVQIYVGEMDHRHAPLTSTPRKRGLDQMGGAVFHTLMEALTEAGLLRWQPPLLENPRLTIPWAGKGGEGPLAWMEVPLGDVTLPPLKNLPEIQAALGGGGA